MGKGNRPLLHSALWRSASLRAQIGRALREAVASVLLLLHEFLLALEQAVPGGGQCLVHAAHLAGEVRVLLAWGDVKSRLQAGEVAEVALALAEVEAASWELRKGSALLHDYKL